MAIERSEAEEHQARLDAMMDEFRAARQRRLEKQAIALGNRTAVKAGAGAAGVPPGKPN
jgi:hypothetical protein